MTELLLYAFFLYYGVMLGAYIRRRPVMWTSLTFKQKTLSLFVSYVIVCGPVIVLHEWAQREWAQQPRTVSEVLEWPVDPTEQMWDDGPYVDVPLHRPVHNP